MKIKEFLGKENSMGEGWMSDMGWIMSDDPYLITIDGDGKYYYREGYIQDMLGISKSYLRDCLRERMLEGRMQDGEYEVERLSLLKTLDGGIYEGDNNVTNIRHIQLPNLFSISSIANFYEGAFPVNTKKKGTAQMIASFSHRVPHYKIGGIKYTKQQWKQAVADPMKNRRRKGKVSLSVFMWAAPFIENQQVHTAALDYLLGLYRNDNDDMTMERLVELIEYFQSGKVYGDDW